jgi:hypothetical protein
MKRAWSFELSNSTIRRCIKKSASSISPLIKRLHNNKFLKSSQSINLKNSLMHDAHNLQDSHGPNAGKPSGSRNKKSS